MTVLPYGKVLSTSTEPFRRKAKKVSRTCAERPSRKDLLGIEEVQDPNSNLVRRQRGL
jgi:hypothetical protein